MSTVIGWLLCAFGRHDWDPYGECRRNWKHVQMYPGEMFVGAGHLLRGTDWVDGPWDRVAQRRREAQREAGLRLQAKFAALGEAVSLELCKDVAFNDPHLAQAMLERAEGRHSRPTLPELPDG